MNEMAEDSRYRLDMDFRPGDMQFLSNHAIFHSRTAYEDYPEVEKRRHSVAPVAVCCRWSRTSAQHHTDFQGSTTSGRPNGIHIPGAPLIAPLIPA